jgi:hypothetical protein
LVSTTLQVDTVSGGDGTDSLSVDASSSDSTIYWNGVDAAGVTLTTLAAGG